MIRGREGGRKTSRPTDALPPAYGDFTSVVLRQRIEGKWNVQAVVAKEDDAQTMLDTRSRRACGG
jgi:hypothetical protein